MRGEVAVKVKPFVLGRVEIPLQVKIGTVTDPPVGGSVEPRGDMAEVYLSIAPPQIVVIVVGHQTQGALALAVPRPRNGISVDRNGTGRIEREILRHGDRHLGGPTAVLHRTGPAPSVFGESTTDQRFFEELPSMANLCVELLLTHRSWLIQKSCDPRAPLLHRV